MPKKLTDEIILKKIKDTLENAKAWQVIDKNKSAYDVIIDSNGNKRQNGRWTGKWHAYKLEPQLISMKLDIPLVSLEEHIASSNNMDLKLRWEDFKMLNSLMMFYDPNFSSLKGAIGEHRLKKFNKNELQISKVVIKETEIDGDILEQMLEKEINDTSKIVNKKIELNQLDVNEDQNEIKEIEKEIEELNNDI